MIAEPLVGFKALHTKRGFIGLGVAALVLCVIVPALSLGTGVSSALHVPDYLIALLGKFLCYGIVALAIDLIWGFTGILSLGHGVFFALGGYAMGMYLMLSIGAQGVYKSALPDFMVFLDWHELPWFWRGFNNLSVALIAALVAPGLLAFCFGYFAFRSRIRGVYFSIITQALTYALMLLFFRNETGFGGNNGLTDFKSLYGYDLHRASTKVMLYVLSALSLLLTYLLCRYIVTSKAGRVLRAIRDAESRAMFVGFNPTSYKLFAWTLSAVLCGLAGALYVPQVGIINPGEMQPANSIEMAIWVAVGGRSTLFGAVLGAFMVNGMRSFFTAALPNAWLYVLGSLFIAVTLFFPDGVAGALSRLKLRRNQALNPMGVSALSTGDPNQGPISQDAPTLPKARAEPGKSKRPWSVRPKTIDPVRRDAVVAGRPAILCVDNVSVSFDGFKALNNLTLILDKGELRCLIGPNGAGKTTLMDVITGKTKPDTGTVFLTHDARDLTLLPEYQIAELGICRKFQRPTVFAGHTVYENMELALQGKKSVWSSLFFRLTPDQRRTIEETLEQIGLHEHAAARAGQLAHGQKQWLEIGMLLAQNPKVLLVDEPIAGMTHQESERTAELLNSLAGERTVVVVEHDMDFVRSIAKKVTVLHEGSVLAEGDIDSVQNDPRVIEVYLGEPRT